MLTITRSLMLLAALGASACNTSFNADLAADPLDGVMRVTLPLDGVVLEKDDSTTDELRRNNTANADLTQFDGTVRFELLSGFEIDEGRYRGARLLFDDSDGELVNNTGGTFDIDLPASTPFSPVTFEVEEDDTVSITLALDLRLSLALDGGRYSLSPVLRAVQGDGASISGEVSQTQFPATCQNGGAAVYLFPGNGAEPKERDGLNTAMDAITTAPVSPQTRRYVLRFLPEGEYTLALTCDGELENGLQEADTEMVFLTPFDVDLDEDESATVNIDR